MYICAFSCYSINNNTSYLHLPSPKAPKLGGKKSQQKEPPTGNVDIEPGQEKEGGTSVVQGKGGWRDNLYFTYDAILVTGMKGSLKIGWKPVW